MNIKPIITILAASAALLFLSGCDEEKYALKFSHHLHVTENEMACDECHGEPGEPSFKALSHETCVDCHDEPEAEEISQETCGYCHQEKQLPELKDWKSATNAPTRSVFVHTAALAGKCQDCHGALMAEGLVSVPAPRRSDVLEIREEAHASGRDCLECHVDMDRHQRPPDHDQLWQQRHGMFGMQDDASCNVCHSEDSCKECHSVMQPRNHNNLWRLKTHGVMAAWDREGCVVCHEEDSCVSCHSQARPRSHRGRWSSPGSKTTPTHCVSCHTSASEGEGCVVCHEGGNDVLGIHEPYWPDDNFHGVLTDCYDCHLYKYDR